MVRLCFLFCWLGLVQIGHTQEQLPQSQIPETSLPDEGASNWQRVTGPDGLQISIPKGFVVQFKNQGRLLVLGDNGKMNATTSYIFIQPIIAGHGETAAAFIRRTTLSNYKGLKEYSLVRFQAVNPNLAIAKIRYCLHQIPRVAIIQCNLENRAGMVFSLAAPAHNFSNQQLILIRIAMSLRYGKEPELSHKNPAKKMTFTPWEDPVAGAFNLLIPKNWRATGGLIQRDPLDFTFVLTLTNPKNGVQLFLNDRRCALFIAPDPSLLATGFHEGRWYSPSYGGRLHVLSYRGGHNFVSKYLFSGKRAPNKWKILLENPLHDLQKKITPLAAKISGGGTNPEVTAGEILYCYKNKKQDYRGFALCATQKWSPPEGSKSWGVLCLAGWRAPVGLEDEAESTLKKVVCSIRLSPSWAATQSCLSPEASQAFSEMYQELAATMTRTYPRRRMALAKIAGPGAGKRKVQDPKTGDLFVHTWGRNYYWRAYPRAEWPPKALKPQNIDLTPLAEF